MPSQEKKEKQVGKEKLKWILQTQAPDMSVADW